MTVQDSSGEYFKGKELYGNDFSEEEIKNWRNWKKEKQIQPRKKRYQIILTYHCG